MPATTTRVGSGADVNAPSLSSKKALQTWRHGRQHTKYPTGLTADSGLPALLLNSARHAAYLAIADMPYTLRELAKMLGISIGTAFRWRHEYMAELEKKTAAPCFGPEGGVVRITSVYSGKEPSSTLSGDGASKKPRMARFTLMSINARHPVYHILHPAGALSPAGQAVACTPTKEAVADALAALSSPGACIYTPLGKCVMPEIDTADQHSPEVPNNALWIPHKRIRPPAGVDWQAACMHFVYSCAACMAIAVKHVRAYMSWYNVVQARVASCPCL